MELRGPCPIVTLMLLTFFQNSKVIFRHKYYSDYADYSLHLRLNCSLFRSKNEINIKRSICEVSGSLIDKKPLYLSPFNFNMSLNCTGACKERTRMMHMHTLSLCVSNAPWPLSFRMRVKETAGWFYHTSICTGEF